MAQPLDLRCARLVAIAIFQLQLYIKLRQLSTVFFAQRPTLPHVTGVNSTNPDRVWMGERNRSVRLVTKI